MKNKITTTLIILLNIACCMPSVLAQQRSPQVKQASPAPAYKLFFEKVYLHTDRDYYGSGDDLWFKAYLVNGLSNRPTYSSNNLYVELISPDSKIYAREILRLDSGMTAGDFKLTDSIPGGTYRLRAYTNWMRNFGDNFIFDKKIVINNLLGVKPAYETAQPSSKNKRIEPAIVPNTEKISFFPEGGSMILGVPGIVGFKAEDALGKGVSATGAVVSEKGDTVARFQSTDAGLGLFAMLPDQTGAYRVAGSYADGKPFSAELAAPLPEGFGLRIKNTDTSSVQVTISTNQATLDKYRGKEMSIQAKHTGLTWFSGKFRISDLRSVINIPKAGAPAGVSSVVLYDETSRPDCERLVYIASANETKVNTTTDKAAYGAKEKTIVSIRLTDTQNRPVRANLSVAAVDETLAPVNGTDIVSYLMLQSEVRGKIENASRYFDPANPDRWKQLDILLLTQGWRDFVWKRVQDSTRKLSYLPESGFTVSGKLRSILVNKPLPNVNITLFAPGAKGGKLFATQTDVNGKYYIDGIQLYGNQTVKLTAADSKGEKKGWIFLDSLAGEPAPINRLPLIKQEPDAREAKFIANANLRLLSLKKSKLSDGITLKEVNIKEAPKTLVLNNGSSVHSFGYPEYDFDITPKDNTYRDLEDFLTRKVPGAESNDSVAAGIMFRLSGKKVYPKFFVDKQEDAFDRIDYYALTMDQINSIRVNHMINQDGQDVMLIFLSLKPSAFQKKQFNLVTSDVIGYYSARMFYSPNYEYASTKADQRVTLHWEPMISTGANGTAELTYYNNSAKGQVRIIVQGLTDKGEPVKGSLVYSVK